MAWTIAHVRTVTPAVNFTGEIAPPSNWGICLDHAGALWLTARSPERIELSKVNPVTGAAVGNVLSLTWGGQGLALVKVDATYAYVTDVAGDIYRIVLADPDGATQYGLLVTTDGSTAVENLYGGEYVGTDLYLTKSATNEIVRLAAPVYDGSFSPSTVTETITPAWRTNPATLTGEIGGFRRISTGWLLPIRKPASNDAIFQETDASFAHVARHTVADVLGATAGGLGGIGGIAVDEAGGLIYAVDEQENKLHTFSMVEVEEETGDHPASTRFIRRQARRIFRRARR